MTNPVTIFFIVLVIILLAPLLLNRLKIPHIIGMIVAGVAVGPYGLNILDRDSSFAVFGQVGLLYLIFLAGLEIDMYHLKRNLSRGLRFGLLTFFIPLAIGIMASVFVLHIDWLTSTLLAVMYASHTLIGYTVASRYGVTKSAAVLISIVGTIVAVIGSLLVLAIVVNVHRVGGFEIGSLLWLGGKLIIYGMAILYIYPRLTRLFFKRHSDNVTQYVFVLAMVFLASWVAKLIGLEEVLGAFLAGLVLNRYVPASSPLMGRIEFVGNALFIPYFLISVGMLINLRVTTQVDTLWIAAVMLAVALAGKWIPAFIAQKVFSMTRADRRMMFGLTTAHTAVALAVVTIGYNMTGADGERLVSESVLNATILVILVTCAIAPIVTARAATRIKVDMLSNEAPATDSQPELSNVLIPVSNPLTAASLTELAMLLHVPARHRPVTLQAIHVRGDNTGASKAMGREALKNAVRSAATVDRTVTPIERFDLNAVTGIINAVQERDINNIVVGMHRKTSVIDTFLGSKLEQLLRNCSRMITISRCYIPLNTVTRMVVYVPPKAQYETGFVRWVVALATLSRELGCRIIFYAASDTNRLIRSILRHYTIETRDEYKQVETTDDFILMANKILDDDLFAIVAARPNSVSYDHFMQELPDFLQRYFSNNNLLIVYPEQFGDAIETRTFIDPLAADITSEPSHLLTLVRRMRRRFHYLKRRLLGDKKRINRLQQ